MPIPTIDEIYESLVDYADFEEVASLSRAKAFITAAKRYLIAAPQSQSDQGSSVTLSVAQIEAMLHRAEEFVAGQSGVRFLGVGSYFR